MKKWLILFLFLIPVSLSCQSTTEWFPSGLNIQPFTANFLEPQNGFMFALDKNQLQLNIGASRDIVQIKNENENLSFGADFFTYTRLRSEDNFKFPVETIDYLFGVNASYKKNVNNGDFGVRFRFSHLSAHLVDGRYDKESGSWIDGLEPFTFSKEYFELFPYYRINGIRFYIGLAYIINIVPEIINNGVFQAGFDYYVLPLSNGFFTPPLAYDFKLNGIEDVYTGNNIIKIGVKFGKQFERGLSILFSYISGKSVHGEFFNLNEKYLSLGFNLDL